MNSRYIVQLQSLNIGTDKCKKALRNLDGVILKQLGMINSIVIDTPLCRKCDNEKNMKKIKKEFSNAGVNILNVEKDFHCKIMVKDHMKDIIDLAKGGKGKPDNNVEQPLQVCPWGIERVKTKDVLENGNNVKVAIIDTGIDYRHNDLKNNVKGGYNAINRRNKYRNPFDEFDDDNGHGTHVAGTVGAVNDLYGVKGVSPDVDLYGVKVLDSAGSGWISDIIEGIEWCIYNNIDIINMSLGSEGYSSAFHQTVTTAKEHGIIVVCAAGNSGDERLVYPGGFEESVCVSALDMSNTFAWFSTFNNKVDLIAPGVNILSTFLDQTYVSLNGTSMASPHVAGCAALILGKNPSLSANDVILLLKNHATNVYMDTKHQGAGLVNVANVLNNIMAG